MSSTKVVPIRKPASKRTVTPKKNAVIRNQLTRKKAEPKNPTASRKKIVVKVASRKTAKPVPKKKVVAKKSVSKKVEAKKVVVTRSAPQKVMPKKPVVHPKFVVLKPEVKVLHSGTTEWIGTSAMKAISCPECEANAGELCIANDAGKKLVAHPARIVAYATNRLASRLVLARQQHDLGKR